MSEFLEPCEMNKNYPSMEDACNMVGLDLERPIDCSKMDVWNISAICEQDDYMGTIKIKRTTVLHAFVFNEHGEREELTITFDLISQRWPKLSKNK